MVKIPMIRNYWLLLTFSDKLPAMPLRLAFSNTVIAENNYNSLKQCCESIKALLKQTIMFQKQLSFDLKILGD